MRIETGAQLLRQLDQAGIDGVKFEDGQLQTRGAFAGLLRKIGDAFLSLSESGRAAIQERNDNLHMAMAARLRNTNLNGQHTPETQDVLERIRDILGQRNAQDGLVPDDGPNENEMADLSSSRNEIEMDDLSRSQHDIRPDAGSSSLADADRKSVPADGGIKQPDIDDGKVGPENPGSMPEAIPTDAQERRLEDRLKVLEDALAPLRSMGMASLPQDVDRRLQRLLSEALEMPSDTGFQRALHVLTDVVIQAHIMLADAPHISDGDRKEMAFGALLAAVKPEDLKGLSDGCAPEKPEWTTYVEDLARSGADAVLKERDGLIGGKVEDRLKFLGDELGRLAKELGMASPPQEVDGKVQELLFDIIGKDGDEEFTQAVRDLRDIVLKAHKKAVDRLAADPAAGDASGKAFSALLSLAPEDIMRLTKAAGEERDRLIDMLAEAGVRDA